MSLKNYSILLFSKFTHWSISILSLGAGSTWPGHIALFLNKNFIEDSLPRELKVILVAGTNGKTTTSTLLKFLLKRQGFKVFQNTEGANLTNGIASAIIKNTSLFGQLNQDIAIFEVDENALPQVLLRVEPTAIILLNLFRDQLDRYGEVNTIASNWATALQILSTKTHIFLNADDPLIHYLGKDISSYITYFGVPTKYLSKKSLPHDVDSAFCPVCQSKLQYSLMSYSHFGLYVCQKCGYKRNAAQTFEKEQLPYPLLGTYNVYNTNAAVVVAQKVFNLAIKDIAASLSEFKPAFGRQEELSYKGKKVLLLLSKNPTGFNQTIDIVRKGINGNCTVLFVLNDRIPDGKDVSWIWDVEFELLTNEKKVQHIVVSGDRAYDAGLRLLYTYGKKPAVKQNVSEMQFKNVEVHENIDSALEKAVDNTKQDETLIILATYSGMLETRKLLKGRKLL